MLSYIAFFGILILSFAGAILADRRTKNLAAGIAGGVVTAAIGWFVATMLFYYAPALGAG